LVGNFAKAYIGSGSDYAYNIGLTQDGGYIVSGRKNKADRGGQENDFLVLKLDSIGDVDWAKTFDGGGDDRGYDAQPTSDGGYIMVGSSDSFGEGGGRANALVVKMDASGNIEWANTYGGRSFEMLYYVLQTNDGGYITTGWTSSFGAGGSDILIMKLSSTGVLEWAKTWGGSTGDRGFSIQPTSDGGYILAGTTNEVGTDVDNDGLVLKLDSEGVVEWARVIGPSGTSDWTLEAEQTPDGGYIIGGSTDAYGAGDHDALFIELDSTGELEWAKVLGDETDDKAGGIQVTPDGGYLSTGWSGGDGVSTPNDFFNVKVDSSGNLEWAHLSGGKDIEYGWKTVQTPDHGIVAAAGVSHSCGAGEEDLMVMKFSADGTGLDCLKEYDGVLDSWTPPVSSPSITTVNRSPTVSSVSPSTSSPTVEVSDVCSEHPPPSGSLPLSYYILTFLAVGAVSIPLVIYILKKRGKQKQNFV